ncbi:MAG: bifunctional oligoribonuclease/PAP phosphatase NrnA [Defluviitaleaceae bacterium]|nr:bifunctional oligoribonuclease/PAP phosphatase NrnA [Defluviitaleaceae bacterium]
MSNPMDAMLRLIQNNTDFVLVGHTSPDGDAIGSCYGLAFALHKLGKNITVVLEPYPEKYDLLPGRQFLYTGEPDKLNADVLIALDCADEKRLGPAQPLFNRAKQTACIDHHRSNTGFAMINYIDPDASSTSEMVFRLVERLTTVDGDIAAVIYAGIVTDTGGFKYNTTEKSTLETVAKLMDTGINFTKIYNEVLHQHTFAAGKAMGVALQNAGQLRAGRVVYSHITWEELTATGADAFDLDGIVEYLLNTQGADISVFAYAKDAEETKVSFRSQEPDVGAVAVALGGGGHRLAAGCTIQATAKEALAQALALLEKQ